MDRPTNSPNQSVSCQAEVFQVGVFTVVIDKLAAELDKRYQPENDIMESFGVAHQR